MTPAERPVGMTVEMVRAILGLDGALKTETRRPVKPLPARTTTLHEVDQFGCAVFTDGTIIRSPLGVVGDLVYVRERARVEGVSKRFGRLMLTYEADDHMGTVPWPDRIKRPKLGNCLANGVYKEGARLWLRINSVDVERLRDISGMAAMREGFGQPCDVDYLEIPRGLFRETWDSIYGKRPGLLFGDNPWVWVYRFSLVSTTGRPK